MGSRKRERLDLLLVERGLAESRTRAQALILAGSVLVDDAPVDKAGAQCRVDADIRIRGIPEPYVSRGGRKLDAALDSFGIDCDGAIALDIGASTGGFTDCMLHRGAARVYAIDVGTNQLAWKLRQDARVISHERLHVKDLKEEHVPERCSRLVIDVSFISLRLVIPHVLPFLEDKAVGVFLVKPQFEAGASKVGKGGIVRDDQVRESVARDISAFIETQGFCDLRVIESPVAGTKGNREWLMSAVFAKR